jgi:hypothetical protein
MLLRLAILAGIVIAGALAVSPAEALSMKDCSVKYKAAQQAGTLNGMKWNDFRKANCGAATTATPASTTASTTGDAEEPTAANTTNAPEPAAPTTVTPKGVVFPSAVNPKYSTLSAGKARWDTCLDQYHANKANNALGGLKWIQKGGGYYSLCNAKLKNG